MKKTLERIVDYAARVSNPEEIILFGSMANGTNNVYSDLDLLLVVDMDFPKKQIAEQIKEFARELAIKTDVLIYSRYELEKAFEKPHSFLAGILKSGKIVYKQS
jgi:predicted nucleotidyltransferase